MSSDDSSSKSESWPKIISAVTTPLGFFTLFVLATMSFVGGFLVSATAAERTIALMLVMGVFSMVFLVVAFFAYSRPEALSGIRAQSSNPTTVSLEEDIRRLTEQNEKVKNEIERLSNEKDELKNALSLVENENRDLKRKLDLKNSFEDRVWAYLARGGSVTPNEILQELGLAGDSSVRDQLMALIGKLLNEGKIQGDPLKPPGYYRSIPAVLR